MTLDDAIESYNEELLAADGFDDCIIGIIHICGMRPRLCYDRTKVIDKLMLDSGMSQEDAVEHFAFNIAGAYVGDSTPAFMDTIETTTNQEVPK